MDIYNQFVFKDQLISPVNGYSCKRITKQNIKQFGFDSVEHLHDVYPDFPLLCENLYNTRKITPDSSKQKSKLHSKKLRQNNEEHYNINPKICKKCGVIIDYNNRRNNYCSISCSNLDRNVSDDTKKKISNSIKKSDKAKIAQQNRKINNFVEVACYICGTKIIKKTDKRIKNRLCGSPECKKKSCSVGGVKASQTRKARSKLEIEFYELASKHFKNITHNELITSKWDADVILPDYKIAILWNGIWHYSDIPSIKGHSIKNVVNRDILKMIAFEKIGWKTLIYQDNEWTPETALVDLLLYIRSL